MFKHNFFPKGAPLISHSSPGTPFRIASLLWFPVFVAMWSLDSTLLAATPIPGLFNTGVASAGVLAADGTPDPHYRLAQSADGAWPGPSAFVVNAGYPGSWLANSATSKWIAPQASQVGAGNASGDYKYRIAFDLTGLEPASAVITGRWASDNAGIDILLNGVALGISNAGQFAALTPEFIISSGFIDGTNTLDFVLNNAGTGANPTGLRAELSGTAGPIPPPGTAPAITAQPVSQVVSSGQSVSFTVGATGSRPLFFQWRLNGQAIPNATNSIYSINSASGGDLGSYDVIVLNNWGSATSSAATLKTLRRLGPSSRRTPLVISEIMYNPKKRADGKNLEFIEIHNSNPFFEDVSGFQVTGDFDFTIPPNTKIPAEGYLVIAPSPSDLQSVYGITNVVGGFTNSLSNSGGTVRLRKKSGAVVLEVNYTDEAPWPIAADGAGHSLSLDRPWLGEGIPLAWSASAVIGGSPGGDDLTAGGPLESVVINEILAHTDDPVLDFVELYNHSSNLVNLAGCWLSDSPDTNKFRIPDGVVLSGGQRVAFDQNELGFSLSADGDEIFLVNSNQTRVVDAVRFRGQRNGISLGRSPDGATTFHELSARTPGNPNTPRLISDIVINEIMYDPISGNDDDEYIEIYNRGSNAVSLSGWKFLAGVDFTFPAGTVLGAKSYLVVARNAARLMTNYLNLSAANLVGNFSGKLSNGGERIALGYPDVSVTSAGGTAVTNHFFIVVNEVTYGTGGRWGKWAHGGGSSLELVDARSDNQLASNWADSDETAKAPWTVISHTGALDLGTGSYAQLHTLLLDAGEALLDDVQVFTTGGNLVANATFESGITGWTSQGTHSPTSWETNGGFGSARSLHIRATGRGDIAANRIRTPLAQTLTTGTATIQAKARWLRGHPELLLRLKGNYLEAFGRLTVPANLGTPGAANSVARVNAGPDISEVAHFPVLPAAGQPIRVSARVQDQDGVTTVTARFRVDPSTTVSSLPMNDAGTNGDAVAGDGVFSVYLPAQSDGALIAFRVEAVDGFLPPATRQFPVDAPMRECLVRVGESNPPGAFGTYRIWITEATRLNWSNAEKRLSNEPFDATFVYGNQQVVYNAGAHYSGSPYTAPGYNGPTGSLCGYDLTFPDDAALLGDTHFILDWPVRDGTDQREQLMFWFLDQYGLPNNYRRYINLLVNGVKRGTIYDDIQQPGADTVNEWFSNDSEGSLFKTDCWEEFTDAGAREPAGTGCNFNTLENFTTTGGVKKLARYRWNWRPRAIKGTANDYSDIFNLVDAVNAPDSGYQPAVEHVVDVEHWMRTFAMNDLASFWDAFGNPNSKNTYLYKPEKDGWKLMSWDFDVGLGVFNDPVNAPLFDVNDPTLVRMYQNPAWVRLYWGALDEALNGFFQVGAGTAINALLDAKYAAFQANGIALAAPDSITSWISQRRSFLQNQLNTVAASFSLNGPAMISTNRNLVTISGTAPVRVREVRVNGVVYPMRWTTPTAWQMTIPLVAGTNALTVSGFDRFGVAVPGAVAATTINYTGLTALPSDNVVINEIMYNPVAPEASYVELYNRSPIYSFDLSGWDFNGLGLTFSAGTILTNNGFLVLAKNPLAFAGAYGYGIPVSATFPGNLDNGGETLSLIIPGPTLGTDTVVDRVSYDDAAPWPLEADGAGASLQLIDAAQDNNRVANWAAIPTNGVAGPQWVYFSTNGTASSSALYVYLATAGDIYVDDFKFVSGSVPDTGANLLSNPGFESGLVSWNLVSNFTQSVLSTNIAHSGVYSLHVIASGAGTGNGNSIFQNISPALTADAPYALSFWYRQTTNGGPLVVRLSASGVTSGSINPAPAAVTASSFTPGRANSTIATVQAFPQLWLSEIEPSNTLGLADNFNQREPWIELHNSGTNALNLSGYFLANNYSNVTPWPFPASATIQPNEYLLVWADAETAQNAGTNYHANFRLGSTTGSVVLARNVNGTSQVLDYLNYSGVGENRSYGSYPPGQLSYRQMFYFPTPRLPNDTNSPPVTLFINEWMASNLSFLRDPADQDFDDWIELFNPGSSPVDLSGFALTDDFADPTKALIPAGVVIPANGYLLVWADEESVQTRTNGDLHVNFKLSKGGEKIGLYDPAGRQIDAVTFEGQSDNISEGRWRDGSPLRYSMSVPTPRAPNFIPVLVPNVSGAKLDENSNFNLTWEAQPGRSYRLQYRTNLSEGVWMDLPGDISANSTTASRVESTIDGQRFYRVLVLD